MIHSHPTRAPLRLGGGLVLAVLMTAAPAFGQTGPAQTPPASADPVADLLQQRGEAYSRASDAEQDPEELKVTSALNAEIAARNDLAENQEAADHAAFEAAEARYKEQMAQADADRLRFEAETRAAEEARLRYERDRAEWEATVAACNRGDVVRCRAGAASQAYPDKPLPPGEPVG